MPTARAEDVLELTQQAESVTLIHDYNENVLAATLEEILVESTPIVVFVYTPTRSAARNCFLTLQWMVGCRDIAEYRAQFASCCFKE